MHIIHPSFARRLAALACATCALAVPAPAGALAAAPSVSGAMATAFWGSGAIVAGTVDPNGQAGSYKFEYGTWGLYGSNTAQVSFSASSPPLSAHALLTNLSPSSLYFVRLVANNPSGTTLGANFEFSTVPGPQPRVSVASATGVQGHSATLHATVTPGIYAGSYKFEYSRTRARFELSTPTVHFAPGAVPLSATATVQSLRAGTTYYFRLVAHSGHYTTDGTGASLRTSAL